MSCHFYHFTCEKGSLSLGNAAKSDFTFWQSPDFPLNVVGLNTFCTSQRVVTPYQWSSRTPETLPDEMVEIRRVDNCDLKLSSNFETLLRPYRIEWLRLGESTTSSWSWALRSMVLSGTGWFSGSSSTVASSNGRMTPCWHYLDISKWNRRGFTEKDHMVVNFLVELIT